MLSSEKDTLRIGDVASLAQVEPHVLRYWEAEFPALRPSKTPRGQRLYDRQAVATILTIKRLLYEEGFTIAGARKQLESGGNGHTQEEAPPAPVTAAPAFAAPAANSQPNEALLAVRRELAALLTLLSRR